MADQFYKFENEFEGKLGRDFDWENNASYNSEENYFKITTQCRKSESDWDASDGENSKENYFKIVPKRRKSESD